MSAGFYSNAKVLLTAEYAVLEGALALALPVKFGQRLEAEENNSGKINWEAFENEKEWFSATLSLTTFEVENTADSAIAQNLKKIFIALKEMGSEKIFSASGFSFKTHLNYNLLWGLGSSSTLIANLAQWAEVDPYELHRKVSKGSGYDIACASANGPVTYRLIEENPVVRNVEFDPPFADELYFIYLGNKVDSAVSIEKFIRGKVFDSQAIRRISEISEAMLHTQNLSDFEKLIIEHEQIISGFTGMQSIKSQRFNDFLGEIKSLGAWGGDFALVTWQFGHKELKKYLAAKSIDTIFCFKDFILQPK
jgi:mevalonate kinase